ncbi:MAG TPA: hypothetical protein PKD55_05750 [Bellilinea sp.]|nr:hypothetical protein [Bellilinea sp.]
MIIDIKHLRELPRTPLTPVEPEQAETDPRTVYRFTGSPIGGGNRPWVLCYVERESKAENE